MSIKEKLQLIQKFSGLTQQELALRLGVTFAALNRWINGKSTPRPRSIEKIDQLYKEYSGEKQIPPTVLEAKKKIILRRTNDYNVIKEIIGNPDIRDQFYLSLTYHSNRIEGSTLSEGETAAILFQNAALPNKSLVEQMEARNHRAALEYLFQYIFEKHPLDEKFILKLHAILMNAVKSDAGSYRNHAVRIIGVSVPTANYLKVPFLMEELAKEISRKSNDLINKIADIHSHFEQIHPFADGNGRVGRLLMTAMALKNNLAPVVILQEKRRFYINYLNKAQTKGDISLLEDFICEAILEGYNILERKNG
jgi:Fic family protein